MNKYLSSKGVNSEIPRCSGVQTIEEVVDLPRSPAVIYRENVAHREMQLAIAGSISRAAIKLPSRDYRLPVYSLADSFTREI